MPALIGHMGHQLRSEGHGRPGEELTALSGPAGGSFEGRDPAGGTQHVGAQHAGEEVGADSVIEGEPRSGAAARLVVVFGGVAAASANSAMASARSAPSVLLAWAVLARLPRGFWP